MRDFKIYKIMNPLADVMKQPYAHVATTLSLIWGLKVNDWVDEQLNNLKVKVCTTPQSDETLWTEFKCHSSKGPWLKVSSMLLVQHKY
jgi:hypothetical protein